MGTNIWGDFQIDINVPLKHVSIESLCDCFAWNQNFLKVEWFQQHGNKLGLKKQVLVQNEMF